MSSFFTTPASQRKRKRPEGSSAATPKKRNTTSSASRPPKGSRARRERSESISGSESEEDGRGDQVDNGSGVGTDASSDEEDETAAERRLRLAERYLENIREEVDEVGFDAAEIDRDLIAERLQEDVAEGKGKVYRYISDKLDYEAATNTLFRIDQHSVTGVAVCDPYAYTVSKDMLLTKWELVQPPWAAASKSQQDDEPPNPAPTNITPRRKPRRISMYRGNKNRASDASYVGHTDTILCVAVSSSGKFIATGGSDHRLVIWEAETLKPLKVFTQHRGAVTAVAFRRNSHQLFSASADRTIKSWSLDELAYVETLFGHQDTILDVQALSEERCISVGGRDRTARLWKVAEETQLVFRGGGASKSRTRDLQNAKPTTNGTKNEEVKPLDLTQQLLSDPPQEGSIDRIAIISSTHFITGSDNGALSLWSVNKKKPLITIPLAHGCDPPPEIKDEGRTDELKPLARWITGLTTVPYSDLAVSASWDGQIRVWRVDERTIEPLGTVGNALQPLRTVDTVMTTEEDDGDGDEPRMLGEVRINSENDTSRTVKGVVNDLAVFERGERGKGGLCIVAAVGKEHRLGRWIKAKGAKNGAVVFEIPRKVALEETTADQPNGVNDL